MGQPVIIEDRVTLAANSTNTNVIVLNSSLRRYLRAPFAARGKLLAIQSATGLKLSCDYGSKNVVAESDLRVGTDLQEPNDVLNSDFFPQEGDQLVLGCNNTTGGALDLIYRLVLEPLEADEQGNINVPPDCRVQQRGPISIANNTDSFQLLDGLRYERPPVPSFLSVFMTASATGLTKQVYVDTQSIAPLSSIPALNRIPTDPFDQVLERIEVQKDKQIELSATNRSGGALNVFWRIKLQELYRT